MPQFLAIEPEFMWKVEPMDDGSKLLTIVTEHGEVRIAWDPVTANKLSKKMVSPIPASKGIVGKE